MPRRVSLVVFFGLAGAIMLMVGISAGAAQEGSQSKRAEVGDAQERLMQARMEQSAAYESYNSALGELNQLDAEIAGTGTALKAARKQSDRAQRELEDRASQVYKSGNVAFMDVLVGVDDFSDFATRVDLWMKLLKDERAKFEDLRQARDDLKAQKDLLETRRAQRTEAVESAINRKEQAENAEAGAQAYLDSLSGELRSLIQAEQESRAAKARANAEKLRAKFAVQTAQSSAPEPAPVQTKELPDQQLSIQSSQSAPQPKLQAQEVAPAPQPELQAQEVAPAPRTDPELLAKQQEAERLAAERRAAAEQARAAQAEAERQAELAARQAEARQKAADRREARKRAAAAEAARRQAEQAAIEQAAADLAAQQAADRRAQRQADLQAQRQADQEAQRQAELLAAQRQEEQVAAQAQYEADTAPPAPEATPTASAPVPGAAPADSTPAQDAGAGTAPPASSTGEAVVAEAAKYLGTPYVLGGDAECVPYVMMDCNCLTAKAYEPFGVYLPEGPLEGQMAYGTPVSGPPQAGDLLAWSEDGSGLITHLGIAMGDGTVIHGSAYAGMVVSGTPIDAIPGYIGAVRLV